MEIQRYIKKEIVEKVRDGKKAVILYGPRQVGKTTLCNAIIQELGFRTLSINADEQRYVDVLSSRDSRKLKELVAGYDLLFLDEAQRVPDIGVNLKILIDSGIKIRILATGSSSFDLANKIRESLTGRTWTYHLYPIALLELRAQHNAYELRSQIEERLVWGAYPEVFRFQSRDEKEQYVRQLTSDYLFRDLLILQGIRYADKIRNLLKLLAFQIGHEVSLNELAQQLEMSKETVARYIDLLEKTFVIFHLGGFSRNLRKEVTKMQKYYFFDLGIRNALIAQFNPLDLRNDIGQLWENFILVERLKKRAYQHISGSSYFWRTYDQQEIDLVEDREGLLFGYECKWAEGKAVAAPTNWKKGYPDASFSVLTSENYLDFVT